MGSPRGGGWRYGFALHRGVHPSTLDQGPDSVYHHLPVFGWTQRGYEYPLFWGLVMLAIALRGGGPYSLDRKLGREL